MYEVKQNLFSEPFNTPFKKSVYIDTFVSHSIPLKNDNTPKRVFSENTVFFRNSVICFKIKNFSIFFCPNFLNSLSKYF